MTARKSAAKRSRKRAPRPPTAELMGPGPGGELFTQLCNLADRYADGSERVEKTMPPVEHGIATALLFIIAAAKAASTGLEFRALSVQLANDGLQGYTTRWMDRLQDAGAS